MFNRRTIIVAMKDVVQISKNFLSSSFHHHLRHYDFALVNQQTIFPTKAIRTKAILTRRIMAMRLHELWWHLPNNNFASELCEILPIERSKSTENFPRKTKSRRQKSFLIFEWVKRKSFFFSSRYPQMSSSTINAITFAHSHIST